LTKKWKEALEKDGKAKISRTIGLPPGADHADVDLFPEWEEWLRLENENSAGNLVDADADGGSGLGADSTVAEFEVKG